MIFPQLHFKKLFFLSFTKFGNIFVVVLKGRLTFDVRHTTLSVHIIRNAFPLRSINPNDSVQASWNDLPLSFFASFATLIF